MRTASVLALLAAYVRACTVFRTRFDNDGSAWVYLSHDNAQTFAQPCSAEQIPLVLGYQRENTVAVYAVHGSYMIVVENRPHADDDQHWYKVPNTQEEANAPPEDGIMDKLSQHTRQFFLLTDFKITTSNLHDTHSRLLTPMNRPIQAVVDQPGRSGIPNIYAISCYLNSAVQMLYMIPSFRHQLAGAVNNYKLAENTVSYRLNLIFYALENGRQPTSKMMYNLLNRLAIAHPDLYAYGRFQQYDSAEALRYIVKDIEAELQNYLPRGAPWFFRDLLYTWHSRLDFDPSGDMVLEESMDDIGLQLYKLDQNNLHTNAEIPIEKLMLTTFASAVHGQGHQHEHVIYDLPTYLFVKFPRFADGGRITNHISMPLRLDLSNRITNRRRGDNPYDYELIGVGLHSGGISSNSGHYTAMVFDEARGWTIMNDTGVNPAGANAPAGARYSSTNATCALYRRRLAFPDQFVPTLLPIRPNIDLNAILAAKASPPVQGGGSKSSGGSSGGGSTYTGGGGGGSGGGTSKKSKEPAPTPTPASEPPRRIPASGTAISVSSFLLGSAAAIAVLLV